jgi:hypothetical protein
MGDAYDAEMLVLPRCSAFGSIPVAVVDLASENGTWGEMMVTNITDQPVTIVGCWPSGDADVKPTQRVAFFCTTEEGVPLQVAPNETLSVPFEVIPDQFNDMATRSEFRLSAVIKVEDHGTCQGVVRVMNADLADYQEEE